MAAYTIRPATLDDTATIARHRVRMFQDMGQVPCARLAGDLLSASIQALGELLADGSYVGWLAQAPDGQVSAVAGAHIKAQLPRVTEDGARVCATAVPLVVNVFTEPPWRGQGIARALMQTLMDWALEHDCERLVLHASDAGRPLYAALGFAPTNEMRWFPPSA
jgi:GNAT superfamily N-acetyltransferase